MQVAQTILQQIGGRRFIAMTGARNFVGGTSMLQFDLPKTAQPINKATRVTVTLEADDTYTMRMYRWHARRLEMELLCEEIQIYWDELQPVFTRCTGLDTHL